MASTVFAVCVALLIVGSFTATAQGDNLTLPLTQTTRALEGVDNQVCPQDDIRELIQTINNQEIDAKLMNLAPIMVPCDGQCHGRVAHCPATSCREIVEQSPAYPPSGYYWLTGSDGTVARRYCDMVRDVVLNTSCSDILERDPSATSDYYSIVLPNGTMTEVYCEMAPQCTCNCGTPYTRVAFVNMTDSSQQCPGEFMEVNNSRVRACGRNMTAVGCDSATFSVLGMEYQHVCGRIVGWQVGSTDGFWSYHNQGQGIDGYYVEGISITYGGPPREHIWSLAGTLSETYTGDDHICPCSNTAVSGIPEPPPFVGNDYYCETGRTTGTTEGLFYEDADPLWDSEGCGSTSTCCDFNNPPWFCKQLPQPTTEDIEVRVCANKAEEETPFELIEIYIR